MVEALEGVTIPILLTYSPSQLSPEVLRVPIVGSLDERHIPNHWLPHLT